MAIAAIKGEQTLIGLAQGFDVHLNQIKQWRDPLPEGRVALSAPPRWQIRTPMRQALVRGS